MTMTTSTDVATIPRIHHREAMSLQAAEFERALGLLHRLDPADWSIQTICPAWDVRRMWLHVLGASEAGASIRENVHQMRAGRRHSARHHTSLEEGLSAIQVAERDALTPTELVQRFERVAPRTVKGRSRTPRPVRAIKMAVDAPVVEKWSLGYLIDIIYLRDTWMHRVDTSRAVGLDLELTADHDGRIVADVVAEWARRHGEPFDLELTGPAGGVYTAGAGGTTFTIDAVDFCWILAGRGEATGLLSTIVPF